jgi:hypothetical protein
MRRTVVAGSASWSEERVSESWSPRMGIRVVTRGRLLERRHVPSTLSPSGERVAERSGAGRGGVHGLAEHVEYALEMLQDVLVLKSKEPVAEAFQVARAALVILALVVM